MSASERLQRSVSMTGGGRLWAVRVDQQAQYVKICPFFAK
jgi:hypothetical protein